jgi:hypothetical protein
VGVEEDPDAAAIHELGSGQVDHDRRGICGLDPLQLRFERLSARQVKLAAWPQHVRVTLLPRYAQTTEGVVQIWRGVRKFAESPE